ncbi:hypothetical protein CAP31_06385 [Sulfuriferula sp. AH1]|nr:hypothetical protein CAP31_06385 [Sulfuriferula sp. AH1]
MGNICRSPMAEGVFTQKADQLGLAEYILIDSAGTHDYHIGAMPDRRARQTMADAGYDISGLRARQVCSDDFEKFDHILAMDENNLAHLKRMAGINQHKVQLCLNFSSRFVGQAVPDPYYGEQDGFELVRAMVDAAADGLLIVVGDDLKA